MMNRRDAISCILLAGVMLFNYNLVTLSSVEDVPRKKVRLVDLYEVARTVLYEGPKYSGTDYIDPDHIVRILHAVVAEKGYTVIR